MKQHYSDKNADLKISVNGTLIHRDQPAISVFDSVVQGGDAVWEGLRLYDGRIFKLDEHLARLEKSATMIGFTDIPSREAIVEDIRNTLEANGMRDGVHIRLTLTRGVKYTSGMDPRLNTKGPTLIVVAEHKPPVYDKGGIKLVTATVRRPPPEVLNQHIHSNNLLNSILAKIEANKAGADDALLLDTRGYVAETNATHLFLVTKGALATPDTFACPEGITRQTIIEICAKERITCAIGNLKLEDFYQADEVFCTGTMGELAPVVEIDGETIGDGKMGPMTERLSRLYADHTSELGVRVVP